jgi:hypothetical protein
MITVEIPEHMSGYRQARLKAGLSSIIGIDPCIFDEIKALWAKGVITYGSCCGHNLNQSMVNVADECIDTMLALGYVPNHPDPKRRDTFKLLSA